MPGAFSLWCGLITYVHDAFKSEEIHIDQITTGWEQLTVEIYTVGLSQIVVIIATISNILC